MLLVNQKLRPGCIATKNWKKSTCKNSSENNDVDSLPSIRGPEHGLLALELGNNSHLRVCKDRGISHVSFFSRPKLLFHTRKFRQAAAPDATLANISVQDSI